MPTIVIALDGLPFAPGKVPGKCLIYGRAQDMTSHYGIAFEVEIGENDNTAQIDAALKQAAVDEFARANPPILVAPSDRKILFSNAG